MSGMDQTHQNIPKRSKTVSCLDKCSWFLEQLQDSLVLNSSPSVPAVRLLGLGWHHQGGKLNRTASSCSPHHSHSRLVCHDFSTRSSSSSSSSFTCHFSRIEAVSSSLFRSLLTSGLTGRCTCCAGQFQDPKPVHTELKAAPMVRPGELSKILRCNTIKYNYKLYIQNNINIYHRFMMTHDDSWWLIMTHDAPCQWNESAILHLFSKLKSGMNLPSYSCISANLGTTAFSSIFFLTTMGIRGSVLDAKGIRCPRVKSQWVLHHGLHQVVHRGTKPA